MCNILCSNNFFRLNMINNPTKQVSGPFVIKYQKIFSYTFLLIGVYLFFNIGNETWDIIKSSIADAYIQVSSFVDNIHIKNINCHYLKNCRTCLDKNLFRHK